MGDDKDKPVLSSESSAGRVQHDDRGRNVWQWSDARIDIDSTTILLKKLENDALQLEPTQSVPIPHRANASGKRAAPSSPSKSDELTLSESMRIDMGGGFNPYDHT